MSVYLVGLNHKTAPIHIREKVYLTEIQRDLLLSELRARPEILEAFIISTCNRTELYCRVLRGMDPSNLFLELISSVKGFTDNFDITGHLYVHRDADALRHLLEVVTGLDSLILGEKQILGQIRDGFDRARRKAVLSGMFNLLSRIVLTAGKRAQTETDIGYGGSSVSWAAIVKAQKELGNLSDRSVLVIGAGQMSKIAVGQIVHRGYRDLYIMNRTYDNAREMAERFNGVPVPFCDIKDVLPEVDLCICSSSAPHYILDAVMVRRVMEKRRERKLVLIDISMPRNIDPDAGRIPGAVLHCIDDLDSVVEENMIRRQGAVKDVRKIIAAKLDEFDRKWRKQREHSSEEENFFGEAPTGWLSLSREPSGKAPDA